VLAIDAQISILNGIAVTNCSFVDPFRTETAKRNDAVGRFSDAYRLDDVPQPSAFCVA
jgi:hypothetical protein